MRVDSFVGPSVPFAALALKDLDASVLEESGYGAALAAAVEAHARQAFVLEAGMRESH